ncbi:MAG: tRNA dihydrouridine synthase, partial [Planctomycetota bacterium]
MSSHPQRLPLRIGPVEVDPPVLMAPMAGFTTFAFRHVLRTLGGCGLPTTEMFSARGLRHIEARGGSLPDRLWGVADEPRPLVVQIWDNDPATMASVGRRLATELGVSVVDLNFGCPVPDVALKAESGSYLLRSPERVGQIVSQVAAACAPTPVTAKIRLGVSRSAVNAAEVAQAVEEGGGAAVTIHGRTAADMYRGRADWDAIARVKDYLRRIPLIGNGDLTTAEAAVSALARYP